MSQSRERYLHSRRSEPCLHRSSPFHFASMSEEEGASARASRACPSHLTTMQSTCLARENLASVCCVCCEQCSSLKHSKMKLSGQPQQLRETLQVYLIRIQVEEATMDDKQTSPMQHLSLISNAYEALAQHMQSLEVSCLAMDRVLDIGRALLAYRDLPVGADCIDDDFMSHYRQIEIERNKRSSSLQELMECCSKNVDLPEGVCMLLDNHRDRRKNFFLASTNFKNLLENSRLSVSQMEKLHQQYNTILKDFQQSRRFLNTESPRIINSQLEALQRIFHKVAELYGNTDHNVYITNLFKLIATNLRQTNLPNIRDDK